MVQNGVLVIVACALGHCGAYRKSLVRSAGSEQWVPLGDVLGTLGGVAERAAHRQAEEDLQVARMAERKKHVVIGSALRAIGLLVTCASYSNAAGGGGKRATSLRGVQSRLASGGWFGVSRAQRAFNSERYR